MAISPYYNPKAIRQQIEASRHREVIGGMWDEIGQWQFDLMRSVGLLPQHKFLDVGCGSFRGGVKFVDYLEAGQYYGIDLRQELLDAGYEREIVPAGLWEKLPSENLLATDDFNAPGFGGAFDFALALSVFSHLPFNHVRVGLTRVVRQLASGGQFVFTYFECPEGEDVTEPLRHEPGGITSHPTKDPYHYRYSDLKYAVKGLPVELHALDYIPHPRNQQPVVVVVR